MAGAAPRRVREFLIGPRLGSGTQGRVYKATSETTGEEVALKVTDQVKLVSSNPAGSPSEPALFPPPDLSYVSINSPATGPIATFSARSRRFGQRRTIPMLSL